MPFLAVNGARLHYERSGAGQPLVLVHGSWVDGRVWNAVLSELGRSFDVVSYDRRGHSRSWEPPGQGSIHDDVDDLAALIEELGLAPAHVAGASWGGSIALRLATARPDLPRSVAVHEPPFFDLLDGETAQWHGLAELRARLVTIVTLLGSGDLEAGARLYFDHVAETSGGWEGLGDQRRRMLLANALTYLDQCRDPDALDIKLDELGGFEGPVLVTYGGRRQTFFRQIVELVAGAMPWARVKSIPDSAHDPQVTHPDSYARVIADFATATFVAQP